MVIIRLFFFMILLSGTLYPIIVTFDVLENKDGHTIALLGDYHLFDDIVEDPMSNLMENDFNQLQTMIKILHARGAADQFYHILIEEPSNLGKKRGMSVITSLKDYIGNATNIIVENVDIRTTYMAFFNLLYFNNLKASRLACKSWEFKEQDIFEDRTQNFLQNGKFQLGDKTINLWCITFGDVKTEFESIKQRFRDRIPVIKNELFKDLHVTSLQYAEEAWQALEHLWIKQARLSYDTRLCFVINRIDAGGAIPLYYSPSTTRAFCERSGLLRFMPSLDWYVSAPLVERTMTAQEFRACLRKFLVDAFGSLYRLYIMERIMAIGSQRKILVIGGCYHTDILKGLLKFYGYTPKVSHGAYPMNEFYTSSSKLSIVNENLFEIL